MNVEPFVTEHRRRRGRLAFLVAGLSMVLLLLMGSLTTRAAGTYVCWDGSIPSSGPCPPQPTLTVTTTSLLAEHSRTYNWSINLSPDAAYGGIFGNGDSWTHDYTLELDRLDAVDRWRVSGTIEVHNPTAYILEITRVYDKFVRYDGTAFDIRQATVTCPVTFPTNLQVGATLTCSFSLTLPDGLEGTNQAGVMGPWSVGAGGVVDEDSATFGPPVPVNDEVTVETTGQSAEVFTGDGTLTFDKFYACDFDFGTHVTTATIVETGQSDGAVVTVSCTDNTNGQLTLTNETAPAGGTGFHLTFEPNFLAAWTFANGPADPLLPSRLDVDSDGNVYVATYGNRVVKLSNNGGYLGEWGGLGGAQDVAVDGDNNVYVLDNANNNVRKYDSSGVLLDIFGGTGGGKGQLNGPIGLAVDAAGNVYVADSLNDRLSIFNSDGDFVAMWGKNVVVGNAETGYEICTSAPADTCQGNQPGSGDGEFDTPFDVAVDSAGNVYVADAANARIQKFSSDGSFLIAWGQSGTGDGEFSLVGALGVDVQDYVYVVDYHNNRVQKFTGDGVHIATWGGLVAGTGPGEFNQPVGIAFDDANHAFVSEEAGARVQKFVSAGAGLDDQQAASFALPPGTYEVVNVIPDGWLWEDIVCNAPFVDNGDSITVEVDAGDNIVCDFLHETVANVADLDGVADAIEDGAPNGGDGNNDGIPDSEQNNVASLPDAESGQYVTVVQPRVATSQGLRVSTDTSGGMPQPEPTGTNFDRGVVEVSISAPPPLASGQNRPIRGAGGPAQAAAVEGAAVQLTLFFEGNPSFDSYYKFGPTPDNTDPHWYEFLYDGQTGAEILSDRIILYFVDGARGDSDLTVNGVIDDPGGPVVFTDAELTVIKEVSGMAPADWSFAVAAPGLSPNALALTDDDPDHTYSNVAPGPYTLTETDQPGWIPSVSCLPGGETGGNAVTVDLEAGENGICRFTNQICFPGTYDNGTACVDAAAGYYAADPGSSTQTACAAGFFQPNPGQPGCFGANEGHYAPGPAATAETPCALGTYQPDPNQSSCLTAGAGYYVPTTGATGQTACAAGTYQPNTGQSSCLPASAGHYVPGTGATGETACAAGTYQPDPGQSACRLAFLGHYVPSSGAVNQTACAAGTFQDSFGQSSCEAASPGHYVPGTGATRQTACAAGTYQPNWGQSACLIAGAGYYVPTTGATSPTACPSGTSSPPGSDNIADCVPVAVDPADVYLSTTTAGTIPGGPAFGFEDILRYDGTDWTVFFDGSAAGLLPRGKGAHDINAFSLPDPSGDDVVIAFTQNARRVPGITPKVEGMDLVWWNGSAFSLWFDGSDVGLTNMSAEKIDGLHVLDGADAPGMFGGACDYYLLISTQAKATVPAFGGGQINASGEDVLGFCMSNSGPSTTGAWHMVLDGSTQGMPLHSTVSLSLSEDGETLYLTTKGTFFVDGAAGGHSMVYAYDMDDGLFSGPHFKAVDEGLSNKVDGLQVVGDLR